MSSLRSYIWISFIVFTFAILGLLWFFQYLLLESYYSAMKTDQLVKVAESISSKPETPINESFQERITTEAFRNSVCIAVTDTRGNSKFFCNMLGGSSMLEKDILTNFSAMIYGIKSDYENQEEDIMTQAFENTQYDTKSVVVVTKCELKGEEVYVYIESSLEMLDSTSDIIRTQLFYITIILFELAFIITLFISSRLSQPITKITETAKRFAEGDFTAKFEDSSYVETKELAKALDKARKDISKITDLRRDLIANVSHDLRTPLTIIKSYAEMIRDISGNKPEKREEHLQVIIDESDRLSALVSSLLELSKLESGNMEMEYSEFSINQKLDEIMQRYALLCENDGYDITLQKDEDRICKADVSKLEQVFYNLINNAVNYCGEGKKVSVVQINKENAVRIEVHDDGEGIPKDQLPMIFDRYYRNERHKRDKMGTGLGLSIVKEILKMHEFPFGVSSEVGKGSVFWFEIVLNDEK
ncbi:MAG: HAMP domain-containing histidine kinase [Ruminococcus sp.]|nr:HAMP domain-containing histidine kinase [Ruminococcus sp.]